MPERQQAKKLKSPLYCAEWIGKHCIVAGGGGRQSTGLPNRLWCIEESLGVFSDDVHEFDIRDDAPMRMAMPINGSFALLAMGFGGLLRVDLDLAASPPVMQEYTGVHCQRLKTLGDISCLCLSRNVRHLALGIRDGPVQVLEWPSLQLKASLRREGGKASSRAPRDVAFSTSHGHRVVAVVYEDGSCGLWDFYQRMEVATLELPSELRGGSISRLAFQPPPSTAFYTAVNAQRKGFLVRWNQDRVGNVYAEAFQKVHNTAITALDASRSGTYLGTGTSDGDSAIFRAADLSMVNSKRNGHMVFCTSVAFSSEDKGLLSVSGDASMRILQVKASRSWRILFVLVSLCVVVLAVLLQLGMRLRH